MTLTVGVLTACNNEPADSTGGASQTTTSPGGSTGSGSATEGPGTGGVTEGATGSATGSTSGETAGETMSGEVTTASATGATETGTTETETGASGTSTGADLCADFQPPGCMESGCGEGEQCVVLEDECVSSGCLCEPATGEVVCTPDCNGGSCVKVCPDILCDLDCEFGFQTDRDGCQICACEEPPPPAECGCKSEKECVKTSSGCCPCNAGGDEVAAHMSCVDKVKQCDLPPEDVICPQVYLCTDLQPACIAGQCVLI